MISGPVFPRTRAGLWELIECHLDEVETGLVLVERNLEFEPGAVIDALAHDAAGHPVFLFTVDRESERELPARILALRAWLATGMPILQRYLPRAGLDYELPPRMVVSGFEVSPVLVQQLADLNGSGIEVYQIRSLRVGGRAVVGALPLLGAAPLGEEDSFRPPRGVSDPQARTQCVRFLDLMQRIEPEMLIRGDRYARKLTYAGCLLAELCVRGGTVSVRVPADESVGAGEFELSSDGDCLDAVDRVMRRYLAAVDAGDAAPRPAAADRSDGARRESELPVSLERLRDTVQTSQLSQEEYSVLGDSGPGVD